jgi:hypothetical protein
VKFPKIFFAPFAGLGTKLQAFTFQFQNLKNLKQKKFFVRLCGNQTACYVSQLPLALSFVNTQSSQSSQQQSFFAWRLWERPQIIRSNIKCNFRITYISPSWEIHKSQIIRLFQTSNEQLWTTVWRTATISYL